MGLLGPKIHPKLNIVRKIVKFDQKMAEKRSKINIFRKKLEITKYHQNICLCEILGHLVHFWAQNG